MLDVAILQSLFHGPKKRENFYNEAQDDKDAKEWESKHKGLSIFLTVLSFIWAIWAAVLCWECNRKADLLVRIILTVFAFFCATLYLIFYLIYHKVFLIKCL